MAIDDSISNYDTDVSTGSSLSLQPASGDEWLLTMIAIEGGTGWVLLPHTNTADYSIGLWGGVTTAASVLGDIGINPIKIFTTNGEYVRMRNNSGVTQNAGYAAVKSKD